MNTLAAFRSLLPRRRVLAAAGLMVLAGLPGLAQAQADKWPQRTVRLVVPFPAGGDRKSVV